MQSKDGLTNNKILTGLQKDILNILFGEKWFCERFYLTGGTALSSFYLYHRLSDDLDFFTHTQLEANLHISIVELLKSSGFKADIIQRSPDFFRLNVNSELKLDFAKDVDARYGRPKEISGVIVDDIHNIAVNKVLTILGRLDVKDYVDLYFILKEFRFNIFDLLKEAKTKDAGVSEFIWSRIIADCEDFKILPRMIKDLSLDELKKFFETLRDDILDHLKKDVRI